MIVETADLFYEIKEKIFSSASVLTSNASSSQATQYWRKYILDIPCAALEHKVSNYPKEVEYLKGLQFTVHISSSLVKLIKLCHNSHQEIHLRNLENYLSSVKYEDCQERNEYVECITLGSCYVRYLRSSNILLSRGQKILYSPVYYCVQYQQLEPLKLLLAHDADVTTLPLIYSLQTTAFTPSIIMSIGGEAFLGNMKIIDTFINRQGKEPTPLPSDQSKKAPTWEDVRPTWKLFDSTTPLTHLQLAFSLQNYDILSLLLDHQPITSPVTQLSLSTTLPPFSGHYGSYPSNLSKLTNLLTLHIQDPLNLHVVPLEIFTLTQLQILNLQGSGFTILPNEISQLSSLQQLHLANMAFKSLPLLSISQLSQLCYLNCQGMNLPSPPNEIIQRGPEMVARYVRDLGEGAVLNTDVLLMLIGDGEAGKTSTLKSLQNKQSNNCENIDVDNRTIGIDISDFIPDENQPLRFFVWDFAGQGVYAMMQQLFMSKRAIYPLLWRVRQSINISHLNGAIGMKCDVCNQHLLLRERERESQERQQQQQAIYRVGGQGLCHANCVSYDELITSWTERLQFRVPGVTVILIATHIDCATEEEVNDQCQAIKEVAQRILKRQEVITGTTNIPTLKIFNNGESIRINNLTGEGVEELRRILCSIAMSLDSYGEVLPTSYVKLRQRLREMHRKDTPSWRTWLSWEEYVQIAHECDIFDISVIHFITKFFHDIGELRYFGEENSQDIRQIPELLQTTVFPNPYWIVDVLRGLIRHDHGEILQLIKNNPLLSSKQMKILRRRVYRLMQKGLLHKSILPYIWKDIAGMHESNEQNEDEFARLIALLQAFDILMNKQDDSQGNEWIVPCLASGKRTQAVTSDSFVQTDLPFVCRLVYDALPPFFDIILVAHIMNTGIADSVNFLAGAASFRNLSETALLCAGMGKVHDPKTVFRVDQLDEGPLQLLLREDQRHIVIASSCRSLLIHIIHEIHHLESFFPGLRRLCTLFPCYSCRMKKIKFNEMITNDQQQQQQQRQEHEQQLKYYREVEERDLQMKLELPILNEFHTTKHIAYFQLHRIVLESAQTLVPEVSEFLGNVELHGNESVLISGFCRGREKISLRAQREVLFYIDNIRKAMDLTIDLDETSQQQLLTLQEALKNSRLSFQSQIQCEDVENYTIKQLLDFHSQNIISLAYAKHLSSELESLCVTFNYYSPDTTCHSFIPLMWNDAIEPLYYFLSLAHNCIQTTFQSEELHYNHEHYLSLLPNACLDINLLTLYFNELDVPQESISCPFRNVILERHYLLLVDLWNYLQSVYSQEGNETMTSNDVEIIEYEDDSLLQPLLNDSLMQYATTVIPEFANLIDEICGSYLVYHPQDGDEILIRNEKNEWKKSLGNGEGGEDGDDQSPPMVWDKSSSNNPNPSKIRPVRQFPLKLKKCSNKMIERLSFVKSQLCEKTNQHFINFFQDSLVALNDMDVRDLDETSIQSRWNDYQNEHHSYSFLLDYLYLPQVVVTNSCYFIENIRRLFQIIESLKELENTNETVMAVFSFHRIFKSNYANLLASKLMTSSSSSSPSSSSSSPSSSSHQVVTIQMVLDYVNYYFDSFQLLSKGDSNHANDWSFLQHRKDSVNFTKSIQNHFIYRIWCHSNCEEQALSHLLVYLSSLIHSLRSSNGIINEFYQLKETMIDWEAAYPISVSNPNKLTMEQLLKQVVEADETFLFNIIYYCRHIGRIVTQIIQQSKTNSYDLEIMREHGLRLFSYLKSDRDISNLEEIIEERMVDLRQYFDYLNQFTFTDVDQKNYHEVRLSWSQQGEFFQQTLGIIQQNCYQIIDETNQRMSSFNQIIRTHVHEIIQTAKEDLNSWYERIDFKTRLIQQKKGEIQDIIETNKRAWKQQNSLFDVEDMKSRIRDKLQLIWKTIRTHVDLKHTYVIYENNLRSIRIKNMVSLSKKRQIAFQELMELRLRYGPPWYFGSGNPIEQENDDLYEDEVWEEDWEKFVTNHYEISQKCPGEYEESVTIAQPDEPCTILISHTEENYSFAKQLIKTIEESELGTRAMCSLDCNEKKGGGEGDEREGEEGEGKEKEISQVLSTVKTIISCIDCQYATNERGLSEYSFAERRHLEIIPLILPGYEVVNYQHWWPPEIPTLSRHSLFVDMRSINVNDETLTKQMVLTQLIPTLKAVLSEWKPFSEPPPLPSLLSPTNPSNPNQSFTRKRYKEMKNIDSQLNSRNNSEPSLEKTILDRFIPCENCYLEGVKGGVYDRLICQELLNKWKEQELQRREEYPDDPIVSLCPIETHCSGSDQHTTLVRDLLRVTANRITLPCPSCITRGVLPPYMFQRESCLTEFEYSRNGSISCPRCHQMIPLIDLLQSEVFISYSWGVKCCPNCTVSYWNISPLNSENECMKCLQKISKVDLVYSTQLLIKSLKLEIELEAGVTCWQDVDRLVGGRDLDYEMEIGIKQANVVIIFLDNRYIQSNNCKKEYLFATKHSKYVIPILLPDYSYPQDHDKDKDKDKDHDEDKEIDNENETIASSHPTPVSSSSSSSSSSSAWCPPFMSSLLQFIPIYLTSESQIESLINEITERIQSRFHRSQRYPTNHDVINYIHDYTSWLLLRKTFHKDLLIPHAKDAFDEYIKRTFHLIDLDGNDYIERNEFTRFLDENKLSLEEREITQLINEADLDCDGNINFTEFKLAMYSILEQDKND